MRERGVLNTESLSVLRGKTLAIDASILIRKVSEGDPRKSLQEGRCALDTRI